LTVIRTATLLGAVMVVAMVSALLRLLFAEASAPGAKGPIAIARQPDIPATGAETGHVWLPRAPTRAV
jgi:hypothetical protein